MGRLSFKAEDSAFAQIAKGTYEASVFEYSMEKSKKTNGPMIKWTLKIQEDPYLGRLLWQYTVLEGKGTFGLTQLLDATGVEYDKDDEGNVSFDPDDVVGLPVRIVVEEDEYDGRPTNKIKKILSINP